MIRRTRFLFSSIALAAAVLLAGEDKQFQAGKPTDYANQTSEKVTVGAKAFSNEDLTAEAFGKKTDLLKYGVLPVLVVIQNNRDKTIDLSNMEVSLVGSDGRHVNAISPDDVPYVAKEGRARPKQPGEGIPLPIPVPRRKSNPLGGPEIGQRAFSAKMLPPGDTASGFFYFVAMSEVGDSLYLSGMRDARSGKEILYFEFPIVKDGKAEVR